MGVVVFTAPAIQQARNGRLAGVDVSVAVKASWEVVIVLMAWDCLGGKGGLW